MTTDGQVLQTQTAPNYVVPKDKNVHYGGMDTLYPVDPSQVLYQSWGYQEKLTSSDGQSINIDVPMGYQVVSSKPVNLVQVTKDRYTGATITINGVLENDPDLKAQYFNMKDPSQDSVYTLIVKLLPAQTTVNYVDETGTQLTPTKTLNGAYDAAMKQASYDKLPGAEVSLASHGALQQIIVENSPTGSYLGNTPQGVALGMVPYKYARYTFDPVNPKGEVTVEAYDTSDNIKLSTKLPYDEAVVTLKANGLDVDGTVAAPNYFTFETIQGVQFVYAKVAPTTPDGNPDKTPDNNPSPTDGTTTPTDNNAGSTTPETNPSITPTDNNAGSTTPETNLGTTPTGDDSNKPATNNETAPATAPKQAVRTNGALTNVTSAAITSSANASGVTTPTQTEVVQSRLATTTTGKLPQTDERTSSSLALLGLSLMSLVGLGTFVGRKRRN
ncbi:LPXTG cell wall anchor domain-containing protein [Secundilactobacillus silagei]|uniref:LPXTG cell wall anchor domain-containing protein n=1 Tax=Secundilactobacillus silagei TaxID=1293415 RepID=UPI0006D06141|nr:LPXTG cell wall anchor domain-containing protein [Secundilactobacillus silagei]